MNDFIFERSDVKKRIATVLKSGGNILLSYNKEYPSLIEWIKKDVILSPFISEKNKGELVLVTKEYGCNSCKAKGTSFSSRYNLIIFDNLFINDLFTIKSELLSAKNASKDIVFYISNKIVL